jgi:hypothetical protein
MNTEVNTHNSKTGTAILLSLLVVAWAQAQDFRLDWYTTDGGGTTGTGGVFTVSGTIGQPDAGTLSSGQFTVYGGFWGLLGGTLNPVSPWLTVMLTPTNTVILTWPVSTTEWRLQTTPSLATVPVQWIEIPPPYPVAGTNCSVIQPSATGSNFYRLQWP